MCCRKSVRIIAATECGYRVSIYFLSWYGSKEYQQRLQKWFNWLSNNNRDSTVSQFWKLCHDCHTRGIYVFPKYDLRMSFILIHGQQSA